MSTDLKSSMYVYRLRKLTGLNQREFAESLQVTRGYISQLENHRVDISLSTFIAWTHHFKITDTSQIFDNKKYQEFLDR